jgi:chaperonin GroEL
MKGYFITCIDRCVFRVSRVCQALLPSVIVKLQQISQVQWVRRYASKDIRFGVEACALMLQGVEQLADAVRLQWDPTYITVCFATVMFVFSIFKAFC